MQNQTTSWLVHSWNTFGERMNHEHTRTYKTHHILGLGEALIVFFMIHHMVYTQMAFFLGLPN